MTPEAIIRRLEGSFDDPGPRSSSRGDHDLNPGTRPPDPLTPAAVLVPIVVRHGGPTVLFTQRTAHLEHHAGQVSFPGGHQEPEDASPNETALRETEEEVGLDRRHVAIVGRLDQYVTRTGFEVFDVGDRSEVFHSLFQRSGITFGSCISDGRGGRERNARLFFLLGRGFQIHQAQIGRP